jgi:hypothetical protein
MVQPPTGGPGAIPPPIALFQRITGFWVTQALAVAADLGLADHFPDGPRSSEDLARAVGVHPASLYRLLRALTSIDVVAEESPGQFRLTPLGACLRTAHPQSMRPAALFYGHPAVWGAWGHLADGVRTGEPAFERVHGMGMWPYQEAHPELAATFNQFMTRMTAGREEALLAAYDFAGITTLVDVGGGYGAVFAAVLRAYPHMRGILFDLPQALSGASEALAATSAAARCTLVAGDFFEAVPPGGDAYLLSGILHDWDDERAHVILMNCHRAMAPGGRVLVLDLNMHVMGGGRERTAAEFGTLFTEAGFELTRVVPFGPTRAVVEGVRR